MPVLETLGGALFGAALQVLFDKLDSHQVLDYFRGRKLDEKLLKKLKVKLLSINAVIDDAEQKQFSNSYVKAWLDELRDAVYDAEDLLDEINFEFCKWELEAESQTNASKVCNFDIEIELRMEQILEELEFLSSQKGDLGLKNASGVGIGAGSGSSSNVTQKLPSTSLVVESVIYGRDDDKEMILNWLTSDTINHSQLSILSIVGMGGMGKTTLAQHVYNDPMMEQAKFDIKAWVCVSDEFDVFKVTKTILEAIIGSTDDSSNLEMVQGRLKEKLTRMRFLLVLDDVWNENRDQWKALRTPLNCGAQGSRVLITTRHNKVASIVQSHKVHHLKQLQEDHSWQVFARHAFQDYDSQLNDELKEIGIKIVQKCKGLPLALETVGCLLHTKSSISEWHSILISKIWDFSEEDSKIIPALLLSYYHLPSHLKRCFSYCALFPKDYEFDKKSLILLWMAENFIQSSQQSKGPEEIGEQYFDDLLSRSFFQQSSNKMCFLMHDLLNDLAKYVCGNICFRLGVDKPKSMSKSRHFSFVSKYNNQYCDEFGDFCYAKRLRTFIHTCFYPWRCNMLIHELFSKFIFIRVISLFRCQDLREVPESIGNLKHLCSLDLSETKIRKLPDSTCSLYNLQILKLNYCFYLEELPSTLHKLTNLRHLEFIHTKVTKMPMHLGKLKNLQVLSSFFVGKSSDESNIQQLRELNLHEKLLIGNLQNIVNPLDALAADLKNKTHLVELQLSWEWDQNIEDSMKERKVLENLQPPKYLEKLSIWRYGGTQFPSWLCDNSLSNIVSLDLRYCKYFVCLPPLGLLPFLKNLMLIGLNGVVVIDADFYGSSTCSFPSLETLYLSSMDEWEAWECKGLTGSFPRLQHFSLTDCPKLKGNLPEQLCHLKYLYISECEQLVTFAPMAPEIHHLNLTNSGNMHFDYHPTTLKELSITGHNMLALSLFDTSLEKLCIHSSPNMSIPMNSCFNFLITLEINDGCDSLTTIHLDFFPKLCQLELTKCPNLLMISQKNTHNHLKELRISECPQFESFPNEGLSAPKLESFRVSIEHLKSLPTRMDILLPSLTSLWIYNCPQVESLSNGGLPTNLKELHLTNCSKLVASMKGALGVNPSLDMLCIEKMDMESFPKEGFLPLSLTYLEINHCRNLKKLDYKGLCHLSSLMELNIGDCPSLQCLPKEGLPKSISCFSIWGCPLLTKRCQKPEGEDWEKIAHIEDVCIT
ncbi:putative disease resistance RPP13-like protein 1 [Cajanus cajan]|uniref:putative disease resistance RPP13-like protein 1 n=1 Tax=Cajanus cajan TaxID=3821 RepID=UPI00098DAC8D|nr:putative disease resistance RPP13-like protein 1 [Cajanus cajan]